MTPPNRLIPLNPFVDHAAADKVAAKEAADLKAAAILAAEAAIEVAEDAVEAALTPGTSPKVKAKTRAELKKTVRKAQAVKAKAAANFRPTLPFAVYCRLSKDRHGNEIKVKTQLKWARRWAKKEGYTISEDHIFIDNDLSAWNENVVRPGMEALLVALATGQLAGVICWKLDRITRQRWELEGIIRTVTKTKMKSLVFCGPSAGWKDLATPEGQDAARAEIDQAAKESRNTSIRVRDTLNDLRRDGKPLGPGRAFGWRTGGTKKNDSEAEIIQELAQRVLDGEKLEHLANELNKRGIKTTHAGRKKKGRTVSGKWSPATLRRTLVLPRHAGRVLDSDGDVMGIMKGKPILDMETHLQLLAYFDSRRRGPAATKFLLTNVIACGNCGRPMKGRSVPPSSDGGVVTQRYVCLVDGGGCGRRIFAHVAESVVSDEIIREMANPENAVQIAAADAQQTETKLELLRKLAAVKKRRDNTQDNFDRGLIDGERYNKSLVTYGQQITKIEKDLRVDGSDYERLPLRRTEGAVVTEQQLRQARRVWTEASDDEKRAFLHQYRVRPVVGDPILTAGTVRSEWADLNKERIWFQESGSPPLQSDGGREYSTWWLTEEEKSEIVRGLTAGESYTAIGRKLGRSQACISRYVARNGGAEAFGVKKYHLTEEETSEIARGLAAGDTIKDIAERLGRSYTTVRRYVAKRGGRDNVSGVA